MFSNKFEKSAKELSAKLVNNTDAEKLKNEFREKTYKESNKGLFVSSNLLSFVCGSISSITAFCFFSLFLFYNTKQIGQNLALIVSCLIALLLVVLLESIKRSSIINAAKALLQYGKVRIELIAIALLSIATSIASSYFGAQMLPNQIQSTPILINIDSVENAHRATIEQATILHTYKPTKTLTKQGATLIAELERARIEAIKEAKDQNNSTTTNAQRSTQNLETTFCIVASINEVILLLCVLFGVNYKFRSFIELLSIEGTNESQPPTVQNVPIAQNTHVHSIQSVPTFAPPANHQRPIGFNSIQGNKSCDYCNTPFVSNHKKQRFCSNGCRIDHHNEKKKAST